MGEPMRICSAFEEHTELLMREDVRAYPSRKFKQGFQAPAMAIWAGLLSALFGCSCRRLLQSAVEEALDLWDRSLKGSVRLAAKKQQIVWRIFKKDTALVLRVMMAHAVSKLQQWEKARAAGVQPRSHPAWLVTLYTAIPAATADDAAESESADSSAALSEPHSPLQVAPADALAMQVVPAAQAVPSVQAVPAVLAVPLRASELKRHILEGRAKGKATFPGLAEPPADPPAEPSEEADEAIVPPSSPKARCTWWDARCRCARRVLSDGSEITSESVRHGPMGFLLAVFPHGDDFELELTNDCKTDLETAVFGLVEQTHTTLGHPS